MEIPVLIIIRIKGKAIVKIIIIIIYIIYPFCSMALIFNIILILSNN